MSINYEVLMLRHVASSLTSRVYKMGAYGKPGNLEMELEPELDK